MELFLFRHNEYEKLYSCVGFDINSIPVEHRQYKHEAILIMLLTVIYYILYTPCIISLWKHKSENTCYTLLFFIGITDLSILWMIGLLHGVLALEGAMFCSHPTLIYFTGILITALWMVESSADLLLAIDRCTETISPWAWEILFSGYRIHIWLLGICMYALHWAFFQKPALFNGMFFVWMFNPYVGYQSVDESKYFVLLHLIHNVVIAISVPSIYLLFTFTFWHKQCYHQAHISHAKKMAFLQVFILSSMNSLASFIYVLMQVMELNQWMITFTHFDWLSVHGAPSIVFLLLNKTIRNDCRKMIKNIFGPMKIAGRIFVSIKKIFHLNHVYPQQNAVIVLPTPPNRY
ncbi:hypothetical protein niasHS_001227 [Heterodera schachtii]|uniref:Serpentine Receptor, class T n=1 Tax=Heterodera schachtii TaxID=97005 RepID=A0ABD2KHT2_HETSC